MKPLFLLCVFLAFISASAQERIDPTNSFTIEGHVTHKTVITAAAIDSLPQVNLGEITTVNHKGEVRSTRKGVKAVLLRDFLNHLLPDVNKPKEMGSYYFVLTGSDGYHFVVSHNEVSDDTIYIIVESDGHNWAAIPDRIAVLSLMQPHRGHVAMKGLARITVEKAN